MRNRQDIMVELALPAGQVSYPSGTWRQRLFRCFRRGLVRSDAAELRRVPRPHPASARGRTSNLGVAARRARGARRIAHLRFSGREVARIRGGWGREGSGALSCVFTCRTPSGEMARAMSGVARREARSPFTPAREHVCSRPKVGSRFSPLFDRLPPLFLLPSWENGE